MIERVPDNGFSSHLPDNISRIHSIMGKSSDFIVREVTIANHHRAALFYLDGMVDMQTVQNNVISALLDRSPAGAITVQIIKESVLDAGEVSEVTSIEASLEHVLSGGLLLLLDGFTAGIIISLPGWEDRAISESKTQSVVRGPQNAFTETLRTNTTLVRRRVKDLNVQVFTIKVGRLSKTDVAIMYIRNLADEELIQQLVEKLSNAHQERVLEGEYLEEILLGKKKVTIFPIFYNSDRPDTIAAGIMDGRIAIFIDGTPFVLLVPSLFVDFIQSAEDYYQSYIYSSFIRILRYIGMFICMLAPSIYIALTTYHQDMLPTVLLLSLAAQREGIPFPAFVEAMLMEVTFEILREAGIRMPRTVGQAVSIVGTIVIGQAAVEASIVSAAMVIIVAITGIASFVIPSYAMSIPIRTIRFAFMVMAATFGVYGLTVGLIILIVHLCNLSSFNMPYMSPIAPYNRDEQSDAILRFPFWYSGNRKTKRRQQP